MATTAQMYDEIARILRVSRNNVEYEAERNKSQLLCDVAATLNNLTTLVENITKDVEKVEQSKKIEMNLKNEAYFFMIERGLIDEFREYVANTRNNERDTTPINFIMERFTKQV